MPTELTPAQRKARLAALERREKAFYESCVRRMNEGGSSADSYESFDDVVRSPPSGSVMPSERFFGKERK